MSWSCMKNRIIRARKLTRARILLKADDGLTDEEIGEAVEVSVATIERTRQRFVHENLAALDELPRPGGSARFLYQSHYQYQ